jgi:hypothetical protein
MRTIIALVLTLFVFTGTTAYAGAGGGGHAHAPSTPVSKAQALENAVNVVKAIVEKGKLDSTWAEVVPTSGVKKQSKFGNEWVVTFDNPKAEDKAKQTLYVFLTLGGEYKAASFSGG